MMIPTPAHVAANASVHLSERKNAMRLHYNKAGGWGLRTEAGRLRHASARVWAEDESTSPWCGGVRLNVHLPRRIISRRVTENLIRGFRGSRGLMPTCEVR